ncbi:MAG: GNAT family N-acetyltransferase [Colwellia sp.]|nr:GNAT family N-acetyltransferase [Colwellia sp.]
MKIRKAEEKDIVEISLLWLDMVNELARDLVPNVAWWRILAKKYLQSGDYFIYVAEIDEQIIGFIDYFLFAEPATSKFHCVGQHFFVLCNYRNTNVPGYLYRKVLRESKKQGAQTHELFCFEKEKSFWEKRGFSLKRCLMRK